MTRTTAAIAIIVMVSFMGSLTATLLFTGPDFPERASAVPQEGYFDTTYWNLTDAYTHNFDFQDQTIDFVTVEYQKSTVPLSEWYFNYFSETFHEHEVRINSVIITRDDITEQAPAILYLHGYGERYADFLPILRDFAAAGFVAMGIDQPGSGNSTGYPVLSPFTFLNVTNGPQDASLYHSVWAAARAVTILESLSQVRRNATIVGGDSMGGLVTFILSGIDDRVDGSVAMIAAGNFRNSITSGSLINSVIDPSYHLDSSQMINIIKWFDPLAYTRLLTNPVLLMYGTNDEFFPIDSIIDTIAAVKADLTLNIVPNWIHGFHAGWENEIINWIDTYFQDGKGLPQIDVSFNNKFTLSGNVIDVEVTTSNTNRLFLCCRSSEPGSLWYSYEMQTGADANLYSAEISALVMGKVLFFVIAVQSDSMRVTSEVFVSRAGSFFFPAVLVMSSIGIILLIRQKIWEPKKIHIIREIPYAIGILTLYAGFIWPFIEIEGRTTLSVLEFIDIFGLIFLIQGWFLPSILTGLCLVIALSAFRHRFQFRVALYVWMPILVVIIIMYSVFNGIFTLFGDLLSIRTGIGAIALIIAIPLMQILDATFKKRANIFRI